MPYKKITGLDALGAVTDDDLLVVVDSPASGPTTRKVPWSVFLAYFATGSSVLTLTNTGLHLLDTDASHDLIIKPGSNLTADRTLTITTGDANRALVFTADVTASAAVAISAATTISAVTTISAATSITAALTVDGAMSITGGLTVESASFLNQDLTSDASPTFAGLTVSGTTNSFCGGRQLDRTIAGRQKTYLLFEYDKGGSSFATTEAFDFDVYDSSDYVTYSGMNVILNQNGAGTARCWGLRDAITFHLKIKAYDDAATGKIRVYAVAANYVDYSLFRFRYNRLATTWLGTNVGTDSYVPDGVLVFDSSASTTISKEGTPSNPATLICGGGNLGLGQQSWGTSAVKVLAVGTGTAPASSPADAFQMYSADQAAGNACPHFRTEAGAVVKLYQQAAIANAVGGDEVSKINAILGVLRNAGLIAT